MNFNKQLNDTMRSIHRLRSEVDGDLVDVLDSMLQMLAVVRSHSITNFVQIDVDEYTPPKSYYDVEYVMLLGPYAAYETEPYIDAMKEQIGHYSRDRKQWLSPRGCVLDPQPTHWRKVL